MYIQLDTSKYTKLSQFPSRLHWSLTLSTCSEHILQFTFHINQTKKTIVIQGLSLTIFFVFYSIICLSMQIFGDMVQNHNDKWSTCFSCQDSNTFCPLISSFHVWLTINSPNSHHASSAFILFFSIWGNILTKYKQFSHQLYYPTLFSFKILLA